MKIRDVAYQTYFYFMEERMNIFWNKGANETKRKLTSDPILEKFKFTNVYRACDRVSQYLIRNVIYSDEGFKEEDLVIRIILFKIFNRVSTWEFIQEKLGTVTYKSFDAENISRILENRIQETPIFSAAYLMTGSHSKYSDGYKYKHEKWLAMMEQEIRKASAIKIILRSKSLEQLYCTLIRCSFIGPFLAYQYAIDLNYSSIFGFSENDFVKAGIGAVRGIKKCFPDMGDLNCEQIIRYTAENADSLRSKYGYGFKGIPGRDPTLIDYQNCFCETDKYLRESLPEISLGNKRIKQTYKPCDAGIDYYFPPIWGINERWREHACRNL